MATASNILGHIGDHLPDEDARELIDDITADGKITKKDASLALQHGIKYFINWASERDYPRLEAWWEKRREKWNKRPRVKNRKARRRLRRPIVVETAEEDTAE